MRECCFPENEVKMKVRGTTAVVIAAFVLALSLAVIGSPSASAKAPGNQLFVACQWSFPGSSGPSIKPAPRKGCIKTSSLQPVAVYKSSIERQVRFCIGRGSTVFSPAPQMIQRYEHWHGSCSAEVLTVQPNRALYYKLPSGVAAYRVYVYSEHEVVREASYKVHPTKAAEEQARNSVAPVLKTPTVQAFMDCGYGGYSGILASYHSRCTLSETNDPMFFYKSSVGIEVEDPGSWIKVCVEAAKTNVISKSYCATRISPLAPGDKNYWDIPELAGNYTVTLSRGGEQIGQFEITLVNPKSAR